MNDVGDGYGFQNYDYIYISKKRINPIDSPTMTLQLVSNVVVLIHLKQVYNEFTNGQYG